MRISDWSSDVCSSDLGEEGRRRRCGTGGPRQTRRERGPFRAAVEMREVWHRADDARQSAPGTAIIVSMLRALALTVLIATIPMAAPADAAGGHDSGLVAWVTDGDTRSEEHTSELQSLMRISYSVFCL